ncbi:MAG: protein-export chaperone SecB [Rhodobacteraceae bacterium]|nr:protein-export chaperone SecB [Paracoccaceae bacterium]
MAEEAKTDGVSTDAAKTQVPKQPVLKVLSQYVRDMSFENISAQKGKNPEGQPKFNVQVGLDAKKKNDKHYEVIIKLQVNATVGEDKIFILEVDYGGLFLIENVPEAQMHAFLLIECPRQIFPYLRRIVSDITSDGGFPPLNLDTIDFMALYRQELSRRVQEEAKKATIS